MPCAVEIEAVVSMPKWFRQEMLKWSIMVRSIAPYILVARFLFQPVRC